MPDTDGVALTSMAHPYDKELIAKVRALTGCTDVVATAVLDAVYARIDEINDILFSADAIETVEIEVPDA